MHVLTSSCCRLLGWSLQRAATSSDQLLKAGGEEVCRVYLAYRPLAPLPPGLTLPPLDPRPLPLTLSAAPLFHFPPNNSVTN